MLTKKYLYLLWLGFFYFEIEAVYLFEQFAELKSKISHVQLTKLPTPIYRCHNLEKIVDHKTIFVKRDDLTGSENLYGGNKVRKLEFLLGDVIQKGIKKVITFGCVGSNHALATACYAYKLGLDCLLFLKNQPNSSIVRQNLLLDHYFNAEIQIFRNNTERQVALEIVMAEDKAIYFIPTGGSVPLGILGFVNAAFELKAQIDEGIIPKPDAIYLPIGSCGTTAGLLLGFTLAQINSKIIAVAVESEQQINAYYDRTKKLFLETNQLLHRATNSIPLVKFPDENLILNKDFATNYGEWSTSSNDAIEFMKNGENITLEGTYSAKALSALIADVENNRIDKNAVLLFWNTYCGLDFSSLISPINYKELNPETHKYFEIIEKAL